jgi:GNAT superfamily N-acetyltransferase
MKQRIVSIILALYQTDEEETYVKWNKDGFVISDSPEELDLDIVCTLLGGTYWAAERSRDRIAQSIANSLCFGLYNSENRQIGFLRTVTDYTTFTWVCDVVVHPEYRGRGFGKWLVACMLEHPLLQGTGKMLGTRDAHGLYEQFGFIRRESMRLQA